MPKKKKPPRNNKLYDRWSWIHLVSGVIFGLIMNPWVALAIMAAYEPVENFILSPICWRFGLLFGYESWHNALSDIVFDAAGIIIGSFLLAVR